jgi:hypothetical protein
MKTLITLFLLYTCVSFTQTAYVMGYDTVKGIPTIKTHELRTQNISCDTLKANVIISTKESPTSQDWWEYALGFMVGVISVVTITVIAINQADKDCPTR